MIEKENNESLMRKREGSMGKRNRRTQFAFDDQEYRVIEKISFTCMWNIVTKFLFTKNVLLRKIISPVNRSKPVQQHTKKN